ncbi:MAG: hypothetical protein ABNH00_11145 [Dokdonia sp.]|jgi:hypothetical protein
MSLQETAVKKETFEVFVMLVDALIWPVTLLVILLLFRRNFADAIGRLGSLKANKGGISMTFQSKLDKAKGLLRGLKTDGAISKNGSITTHLVSDSSSPQEEVRSIHKAIEKQLYATAAQQGIDVSNKSAQEICGIFKEIGVYDLQKAEMTETLLDLTNSPDDKVSQQQVNELKLLFQAADI